MSRVSGVVVFINLLCALTSIWGMIAVGEKNDVSEFFYCTVILSVFGVLLMVLDDIFGVEK